MLDVARDVKSEPFSIWPAIVFSAVYVDMIISVVARYCQHWTLLVGWQGKARYRGTDPQFDGNNRFVALSTGIMTVDSAWDEENKIAAVIRARISDRSICRHC